MAHFTPKMHTPSKLQRHLADVSSNQFFVHLPSATIERSPSVRNRFQGFAPFTLLAYPWKNVFFSFSAAFCGKEGEHMTNVLFRPIFPRTTAFNFKRSPLFWKSHCCGIFCPLLPITQWSRSEDLTMNLQKNCSTVVKGRTMNEVLCSITWSQK